MQVFDDIDSLIAYIRDNPGCRRLVLTNKDLADNPDLALSGLFPETLYAEFRRADTEGFEEILLLCDPDVRSQEGLMNRIRKAAE